MMSAGGDLAFSGRGGTDTVELNRRSSKECMREVHRRSLETVSTERKVPFQPLPGFDLLLHCRWALRRSSLVPELQALSFFRSASQAFFPEV
ncbi:unnamed protein product [Lota lota]